MISQIDFDCLLILDCQKSLQNCEMASICLAALPPTVYRTAGSAALTDIGKKHDDVNTFTALSVINGPSHDFRAENPDHKS